MKNNVGILIFDDAEVLDFAGPFEVFSVTGELHNYDLYEAFTIAKTKDAIRAVNGLSVNPKYSFEQHPKIDVLIIAGGTGSNQQIKDKETLDWLAKTIPNTTYTASICSGARLLGVLGLLDGKPYCTHHQVYEDMEQIVPTGTAVRNQRFVASSDTIFTSGGISAGIDLSFHIVALMYGKEVAQKTADYMEYDWKG